MKKIFITSVLALLIFASCEKDDQTGIPPVTGNEKPTPPTLTTIEAATSDVSVYEVGKMVKIHGNITIQNNRSYFKLKDNTLIQIYAPKAVTDALSQEAKNKLATEGQELTVTGKFTDYKLTSGEVIKEIVYSQESDLIFGTTPNNPNPGGGNTPTPTGNKFDFENLTSSSQGYTNQGELTASDGTKLEYKARTDVTGSEIEGKGLMLRRSNDNGYIKLSFASNVTKITFQARGAFSAKQRILVVLNGDENSTTEVHRKTFEYGGDAENPAIIHNIEVNVTGMKTITIKLGTAASTAAQVVIDNISWE
ncbi:hypothetical protein [Capnocytophaga catalasegens]|uniref:hypothetical protein n=1 Tax=Capnocytophaga catalasegens TaxID=1004260 RepID=UPI00222EFD1E|nr:hypothetical protein [Capnocytophaga catalasegens]GIZ15112.1 hypothetical protein RCZ03_11120 [Capnocytophaga catalasegens]